MATTADPKNALSPANPQRVVIADDAGTPTDATVKTQVWNVASLTWVRAQQAVLDAGTVVLGGAIQVSSMPTVNVGNNVNLGTVPTINVGPVSGNVTATVNFGGVPTVSVIRTALADLGPTFAAVGTTSVQAIAANSSRRGMVAVNTHASSNISMAVGTTAVYGSGITLAPNGAWTMDEFTLTRSAINAVSAVASANLSIQEFN